MKFFNILLLLLTLPVLSKAQGGFYTEIQAGSSLGFVYFMNSSADQHFKRIEPIEPFLGILMGMQFRNWGIEIGKEGIANSMHYRVNYTGSFYRSTINRGEGGGGSFGSSHFFIAVFFLKKINEHYLLKIKPGFGLVGNLPNFSTGGFGPSLFIDGDTFRENGEVTDLRHFTPCFSLAIGVQRHIKKIGDFTLYIAGGTGLRPLWEYHAYYAINRDYHYFTLYNKGDYVGISVNYTIWLKRFDSSYYRQ